MPIMYVQLYCQEPPKQEEINELRTAIASGTKQHIGMLSYECDDKAEPTMEQLEESINWTCVQLP